MSFKFDWPSFENSEKCDIGFLQRMNGVLGHDSELLRLYWAGDNLGEWDEFYESCPWRKIVWLLAIPIYIQISKCIICFLKNVSCAIVPPFSATNKQHIVNTLSSVPCDHDTTFIEYLMHFVLHAKWYQNSSE